MEHNHDLEIAIEDAIRGAKRTFIHDVLNRDGVQVIPATDAEIAIRFAVARVQIIYEKEIIKARIEELKTIYDKAVPNFHYTQSMKGKELTGRLCEKRISELQQKLNELTGK